MNRVVEILMNRDNIDYSHAVSLVKETRDELLCVEDPCDADDIIREYLELEPDYLEDILNI